MRGLKVFACLLVALAFGTGCSEAVRGTAVDAAVDVKRDLDVTPSPEDAHLPKEERPAETEIPVDVTEEIVEEDLLEKDAAVDAIVDQPEADHIGPNRDPDVLIAEDVFAEDVPAELTLDAVEPADVAADVFVADAMPDEGADHPDARDVAMADGPLPTLLTVIPQGPMARSYPAGTVGAVFLEFWLVVGPHNLRLWWLPLTLEGVTRNDVLQGSMGTNYLFNRRLADMDTGRNITPPYSLAPGSANAVRHQDSLISSTDPMVLLANRRYRVGLLVDVGTREDAPGELLDGTHAYRVTIGGYYSIDRDHFFAHDTIEDVDLFATRYGPERIAGNVPMIGNSMTVLAR